MATKFIVEHFLQSEDLFSCLCTCSHDSPEGFEGPDPIDSKRKGRNVKIIQSIGKSTHGN